MKNKQQLKMIKGLLLTMTTLSLLLTSKPVLAQQHIPVFNTYFYLSSIYHHNNKTDTLTGTAFLISDNDKVYLVTAKHLIRASLLGADQQLINNNIFIGFRSSAKIDDLGIPLASDGNNNSLKSYILSSDNDDIAIISLQKGANKSILDKIKSEEFIPISISSVEAVNSSSIGDQRFLHRTWITFKSAESKQKTRQQGIFSNFIQSISNDLTSIQIKATYRQGNDGAPLFTTENKLVGMIIGSDVYSDNTDILADPYKTAKSAKAVAASQILLQLKKLQEIELQPNFNK